MDFRLGSAIRDYLNENSLYNDVDIISMAGAAKGLNSEPAGALEGQIDLSKRLHTINTVILMNHTDCGGYGGRGAFDSTEAEREHHLAELENAASRLKEKYPELTIKKVLADIKEDGSVNIEEL